MPAYPAEVELAREEGVLFEWLTAPTRFLGSRRLEAVECVRMRLGEQDSSGRARPEPVPGSEHVVRAETAIVAIGQEPRPEVADLIEGVDPATGRTRTPGFYAAGDAVNGGATVVEAVREAKIAARSIDEDLRGSAA
jgi:NADPH-dependent glutamate synthase beta subunit-like oxidoreductase